MSTRDSAWPAGTPCWADLTSTDPDGARAFYGALFGWDLEVGPPESSGYTMARHDGRVVTAINGMASPEGAPSAWVTYLATDDLDATHAAALAAGATEVLAPFDVMTAGRMSLAVDPTGAFFGLWQAGDHVGFQAFNEPATVVWNELLSRDYEGAKSFYDNLFGFSYEKVDMPPPHEYATISNGGDMVAGIGSMPPEVPAQVPSNWAVYFQVEDVDSVVAETVRLGGSMMSEPMTTPWGRMSTLADPQGAAFSVMTPPPSP